MVADPHEARRKRPHPGVSFRALFQAFADLAGNAFRLLPKKKRFAVARRIALMMAPLVKRTRYYARRTWLLDGPREESLRMVLRTMTRTRVQFDPDLDIYGRELIEGRPVLITSGHFLLNVAMSRPVFDAGGTFTLTFGVPRETVYYFGTTVPVPYHLASPYLFLHMRRSMADGSVGFMIPETATPEKDWPRIETAAGPRYVSPALFTFVARTRTPLVFGATYLSRSGRLTITYEQPRATDAAGMMAEYCDFLRRQVAAVVR